MTTNAYFRVVALVFILLLSMSALFTVHEGQQGLVVRLGELVGAKQGEGGHVYKPGLHFRMPLIETARLFDTRLQTFEEKSSRILTVQQKYVLVDYYVKWRIGNLPLYFKRTAAQMGMQRSNSLQARDALQRLLSQKINNALRAEFGQHTITEVVSGERMNIMNKLRSLANEGAKELGVKVIDVRIKRIDLPSEVSQSVFERMRADRERVATKHRSNGHAQAEALRAQADAQVTIIKAEAKAKAADIRAKGEGKAAKIYNDAFSQDQKFYQLLRSLQAYVKTFQKGRDLIVLRPKSKFFGFFKGPKTHS